MKPEEAKSLADAWLSCARDEYARKHERVPHATRWIDPFSSALAFDGWERAFRAEYAERAPPHLAPQTWLLRVGWKRWGPLRFDEAPRA